MRDYKADTCFKSITYLYFECGIIWVHLLSLFMNFSLSRNNIVSLAFASICLALFAYFPTRESVWEDVATMISFFVILPILYVIFILKESVREFDLSIPHFTKVFALSTCFALLVVVLYAVAIFFSPYNESYITDISPVFQTFKGFTLYHVAFILPALVLVTFFSETFLRVLRLPRIYFLVFGGISFTLILISLLGLPPIASPIFALPFMILWYFKTENIYSLIFSVFIGILTYNVLIAKALLNSKI